MPAAQVELDDGHKSLDRIIDRGDGKEHLGVAHEAEARGVSSLGSGKGVGGCTHLVMRSNMLRGSRMNVGRTTLLRSAPGRS